MDTLLPSSPTLIDAQHILASAVAHRVEQMSKDELDALVAKARVDLQNENAGLKARIQELEAENERLLYRISRTYFDAKDYENFDPKQYSGSAEELLAELHKV